MRDNHLLVTGLTLLIPLVSSGGNGNRSNAQAGLQSALNLFHATLYCTLGGKETNQRAFLAGFGVIRSFHFRLTSRRSLQLSRDWRELARGALA